MSLSSSSSSVSSSVPSSDSSSDELESYFFFFLFFFFLRLDFFFDFFSFSSLMTYDFGILHHDTSNMLISFVLFVKYLLSNVHKITIRSLSNLDITTNGGKG